jgi:hypothetical protein
MGAKRESARRIASMWPGVARPVRSPKPKLDCSPSVENVVLFEMGI